MNTTIIFDAIYHERLHQEKLESEGKFDSTCADFGMTQAEKLCVLAEEFGEVAKEVTEMIIVNGREDKGLQPTVPYDARLEKLRKELVEVAAVCVGWCEAIDMELELR